MASALKPVRTQTIVGLPPQNQTASGKTTAAAIDAAETYLVAQSTMAHVASAVAHPAGAHASPTPAEVAIPLPPLNFNQHG